MNEKKIKADQQLSGFLLINKPTGLTSFEVVRQLKKILKQKIKIGHTGTLDNFATGLLIICIGKATKLVPNFMNLNKEYVVTAKLGQLTDTLDYTGNTLQTQEKINVTADDIKKAIKKLGNKYMQIPPVYSALKHQGKPLYKLARNKLLDSTKLEKIVQEKAREVKIEKIELTDFSLPYFTIKATVSKGTYARALANDIAQQINLYATVYELQRTKIGDLNLKNTVNFQDLKISDNIKKHLCTINNLEK